MSHWNRRQGGVLLSRCGESVEAYHPSGLLIDSGFGTKNPDVGEGGWMYTSLADFSAMGDYDIHWPVNQAGTVTRGYKRTAGTGSWLWVTDLQIGRRLQLQNCSPSCRSSQTLSPLSVMNNLPLLASLGKDKGRSR